jgi:hypothetical protein
MIDTPTPLTVNVSALTFRTKDKRQGDSTTTAELHVDIALDRDLAHAIVPAMATDLFVKTKDGDYVAKGDLREAAYDLPGTTYTMEARRHAESGKVVRIDGVTARKLTCYKDEGNAWRVAVTLGFVLGAAKECLVFIEHLRKTLTLVFVEMEPKLEGGEWNPSEGAPEAEATVDEAGVVQSISERRGRRGGKPPKPEAVN